MIASKINPFCILSLCDKNCLKPCNSSPHKDVCDCSEYYEDTGHMLWAACVPVIPPIRAIVVSRPIRVIAPVLLWGAIVAVPRSAQRAQPIADGRSTESPRGCSTCQLQTLPAFALRRRRSGWRTHYLTPATKTSTTLAVHPRIQRRQQQHPHPNDQDLLITHHDRGSLQKTNKTVAYFWSEITSSLDFTNK